MAVPRMYDEFGGCQLWHIHVASEYLVAAEAELADASPWNQALTCGLKDKGGSVFERRPDIIDQVRTSDVRLDSTDVGCLRGSISLEEPSVCPVPPYMLSDSFSSRYQEFNFRHLLRIYQSRNRRCEAQMS